MCRAGLVFGPRGGLVDESTAGSSIDCPSRADGLVATTGTDPRHSALGSGRALSQPTPTAEIGDAAARGTTLNSTVR